MAKVEAFDNDKFLVRTLFNNFGTLLVFTFYSSDNKSSSFKSNFENSIPIFGDHPSVKYFFLSQETCPQTAKKFEITAFPTVIFTQTDKKVIRKFQTDDIGIIFDALEEEQVTFKQIFEEQKAIWHPKVNSVLNESQVIVFIKGTVEAPKCGFTQTLLGMFHSHGISFAFYDIIADQYMRYWLRNCRGWPTYPQLYSDGVIVGGLDVCKELVAKGEFLSKIPKSCLQKQPAQRVAALIQEYEHLILTNNFSYTDKKIEQFISKAKAQYPDKNIKVYNVNLDNKVKSVVEEKYGKQFPLLFVKGQLKTL